MHEIVVTFYYDINLHPRCSCSRLYATVGSGTLFDHCSLIFTVILYFTEFWFFTSSVIDFAKTVELQRYIFLHFGFSCC